MFYNEDSETVAQIAPRGGKCPISGNRITESFLLEETIKIIKSKLSRSGWQGCEQPDLVEDTSDHLQGLGLDDR